MLTSFTSLPPLPTSSGAGRAVVIGSGFGGLAAAIRLGARGYRVTLLEKLDTLGGRAAVRVEAGHTFDCGPTIITAPFLFEDLWNLCGRRFEDDVELRALSPFYRIRFDSGEIFDYSGDPEAMRAEVARIAPADVAGYDRFMRKSEAIYRVGFEQLGHVSFHSISRMLRVVPDLFRLEAYRSVHGLVARHVRDPRLRTILSYHPLLVGGNPFSVTAVYALIAYLERAWGVHFAMGGTGSLVKGMTRLIEGQGAEIRTSSDVAEITVEAGRATGVRLASGEHLRADVVVSNADSAATYRHLVAPEHRRRWTDRRLERAHYSMGLFVWYFGTRRRYEEVPHHMLLLGPRYRELLDDIFTRKHLAEDFSLYLHRPTATDPSLAPAGGDTFYVLSPVPNLEGGIDWPSVSERYRSRLEQALASTVLPGLSAELTASWVMHPGDFESRLGAFRGAGFGLEPRFLQSAWFRPHNRSEDIRGLYLVGAGTHPGAGLPGVLSSARVLDAVVPDVRIHA